MSKINGNRSEELVNRMSLLTSAPSGWLFWTSGIYTSCELKNPLSRGSIYFSMLVSLWVSDPDSHHDVFLYSEWKCTLPAVTSINFFCFSHTSWARACHWVLGRGLSTEPMVRLWNGIPTVCNCNTLALVEWMISFYLSCLVNLDALIPCFYYLSPSLTTNLEVLAHLLL